MNKRSKETGKNYNMTISRKSKNHSSKIAVKLKKRLFSNIKNRSMSKKIKNEISKDIEKIELEPEDLILIEYIDINVSKKERREEEIE